jgi:hypothetical protein
MLFIFPFPSVHYHYHPLSTIPRRQFTVCQYPPPAAAAAASLFDSIISATVAVEVLGLFLPPPAAAFIW